MRQGSLSYFRLRPRLKAAVVLVTSKFGLRDWGGKGLGGGKQISDSLLVHPTHPLEHLTKLLLLLRAEIQQLAEENSVY